MALNPEFAANPDPRVACVLLLDTSGSMSGAAIDALNQGLKAFQDDIQEDALAKRRVEIAIVTFGGSVQKIQDFISAGSFAAPTLVAEGKTPMGEAIALGVKLVKDRKAEYKTSGVLYYQPWIFLITDGEPTDEWQSAAQMVQAEISAKALTFFAVGVEGANMQILSEITPRTLKLPGLKFKELFIWLSQSQKRVSGSKVGEQTALPPIGFGSPV
ncbi:MAG: vWA domain-containing protein [Terriglobia bacterium]